jgi:group I intron endonuclease
MNSIDYDGSGIYGILNKENKNIYIGGSSNILKRTKEHKKKLKLKKHENRFLQKDYNNIGYNNFEIILIEKCDKCQLIEKEQHYIDLYKLTNSVYNIAMFAKSSLGIKRTEETRKKISEALTGRESPLKGIPRSEETKQKISVANTGYKHTEESKEKNRQAHLGTTQTEYAKQRISEFQRTQTRSEETRRRISEAKKGIPKSEETKEKLRQANLGKKQSNANKEALRQANIGNKYNLGRVQTSEEKLRRSESMKRFRSQQRLEREQLAQAI